jgi:TIP49 AAA-lid domain
VEGISIDEEGLAYLGELSEGTSLRHAVQLLTPAATLAATNGRDDVTKVDLGEVGNTQIGVHLPDERCRDLAGPVLADVDEMTFWHAPSML